MVIMCWVFLCVYVSQEKKALERKAAELEDELKVIMCINLIVDLIQRTFY